ncbi:MAG: xylulokinase [Acidimicrobiales bacterium]|nr:xylulokinase [Acidimicrobiales bacterium]
MALVAGVDSSTSGCKVQCHDADSGEVVASGFAPHPPTTPPRSEQDPAAWWTAFMAAADEADLFGANRPAAISIAGQQHGLVALDDAGEVLRPAKLWNDTETAADAGWLVGQLDGPAAWAAATGSVPVASFTISKLSWLHRKEPEHFERLAHVLLPHDWLTYKLTGAMVTDRGDASGTGYWSPAEGRYRTDLLRVVDDAPGDDGWLARLPKVLGPAEAAGPLFRGAAEVLGLRGEPLVAAGTGDNMAAALGMGLEAGDVALSLGTSGTVYAVSEQPTSDASGAVAGFADATGRFLPLVCTLNATGVTDDIGRLFGLDADALSDLALSTPAGSGGVVMVPFFNGERTPNRPDATGTVAGLRHGTSKAHLARAAYEEVVCSLLEGLDALVSAGVDAASGRTLLVGGGARSRAYRHVLATLSGRAVTVPAAGELVATGACVQAAATLQGADPVAVAAAWGLGDGPVVEPDPGVDATTIRAAYAEARG